MGQVKDKPTETAIEVRLRALEAEVARLKSATPGPKTNIAWIERIAGSFIDDPDYKAAAKLGRAYRRRQPKC
jgi:hypothetical protein